MHSDHRRRGQKQQEYRSNKRERLFRACLPFHLWLRGMQRSLYWTQQFTLRTFVIRPLPRPMMFYFGRYFVAGTDPEQRARLNRAWQLPEVRFCHRLIASVWGTVFVGELILR